uniref:(northern house mosquito) hypothetical protein n=1 Tax=Culex pipiens TaxID=7175 RepID=A0A8D8IZM5_CULPI
MCMCVWLIDCSREACTHRLVRAVKPAKRSSVFWTVRRNGGQNDRKSTCWKKTQNREQQQTDPAPEAGGGSGGGGTSCSRPIRGKVHPRCEGAQVCEIARRE